MVTLGWQESAYPARLEEPLEDGVVRCQADAHLTLLPEAATRETVSSLPNDQLDIASFSSHGDVRALHTQVTNPSAQPATAYKRRFGGLAVPKEWAVIPLQPGESCRFTSAESSADKQGVKVAIPPQCTSTLHEVFDRAHFPTVEAAAGSKNGDVSPLPAYLPILRA